MKKRNFLIAIAVVLVVFCGIASAYVHSTLADFQNGAVPCGPLHGVPHLLQVAKLLPAAQGHSPCLLPSGACNNDHECSAPKQTGTGTVHGNCRNTASGCLCVPD